MSKKTSLAKTLLECFVLGWIALTLCGAVVLIFYAFISLLNTLGLTLFLSIFAIPTLIGAGIKMNW